MTLLWEVAEGTGLLKPQGCPSGLPAARQGSGRRGGGETYLHGVGAAGVLGAGGAIVNGIPRVTAGLVTGQLEQGPVILAEVQLLLLATHEEVLAPGHKADQGLGVEPPQLGVGALFAADAVQEAVEL